MSDTVGVEEGVATMNVFARKAGLRKVMLRTLRGLSDAELEEQSQAVKTLLLEQDFYRQAKRVGCYLSMANGELRTNYIVNDLLSRGTKLYTPYIPPQLPALSTANTAGPSRGVHQDETPGMKMLRLYSLDDLGKCPLDKWGIVDPGLSRRDVEGDIKREDVMDDGVEELDLVLIPGVAFDEDCNRLGRGKAYYDRFLLQYSTSHPRPLLVALALAPQILPHGEKIPITPSDFQLDAIISPLGITRR